MRYKLKPPRFWYQPKFSLWCMILMPFGQIIRMIGWLRQIFYKKDSVNVPVLCCGGITIGGSGKTPIAINLAQYLICFGYNPHFITRGYGGTPYNKRVNPLKDTVRDVGDEALLLAKIAPVWQGADRLSNIKKAIAEGADYIIMDDGLQNPKILKDFNLLTINGTIMFGNNHLIPAGPLREPFNRLRKRIDAIVVTNNDQDFIDMNLIKKENINIFHAHYHYSKSFIKKIKNKKFTAFAGIAYPEIFFEMLAKENIKIINHFSYPDHYFYTEKDINFLIKTAKKYNTTLITTEKDAMRFPKEQHSQIISVPLHVIWKNTNAPEQIINKSLRHFKKRTRRSK